MKRIIACLMAGILMLALVGCGTSGSTGKPASSAASTPKDYTQILTMPAAPRTTSII